MTHRNTPVERLLHELAAHFTAHDAWVFLVRDAKGELRVLTGARPEQARHLAAAYLKSRIEAQS